MSKEKTISFIKMAGAGNDFFVMDARKGINYKKLAPKMCDRTNGLGADGLILFDRAKKHDYKMRIINADGSEAEMCGNGARCLAAYIVKHKKPKKKRFSIETLAGEILAEAKGETAHVRLSDPNEFKQDISIPVNGRTIQVQYIDTGVPHTIIFVQGLNEIDVKSIGHEIRFHEQFKPRGTNVNFVELLDDGLVAARTYERGVEDETKACGTGSVASAIMGYCAAHPVTGTVKRARMDVKTTGGEILKVTFDINNGQLTNVWLKGSARFIAKGEFFL